MGTIISLSSLGLSDGAPVDTALPSDPFSVAPLSLISNPSENVSDNAVGAVPIVPSAAGSSARRCACAQALPSNSRQDKSASVQVVVFIGDPSSRPADGPGKQMMLRNRTERCNTRSMREHKSKHAICLHH